VNTIHSRQRDAPNCWAWSSQSGQIGLGQALVVVGCSRQLIVPAALGAERLAKVAARHVVPASLVKGLKDLSIDIKG